MRRWTFFKMSGKELPMVLHMDQYVITHYRSVSGACLECGKMYFRRTHIKGLHQKDVNVYWHAAVSKTITTEVSYECHKPGVFNQDDVNAIVNFLRNPLQ